MDRAGGGEEDELWGKKEEITWTLDRKRLMQITTFEDFPMDATNNKKDISITL